MTFLRCRVLKPCMAKPRSAVRAKLAGLVTPIQLVTAERSGEGLAAAAGPGGVGVVDREPGSHEALLVVQGGAAEVLEAGRVDHDVDAGVLALDVVVGEVGVEEHLVAEPGAAAGPHRDPKRELVVALRFDELLDLLRCRFREGDHPVLLGRQACSGPVLERSVVLHGSRSANVLKASTIPGSPAASRKPSTMPRCRLQTRSG